MTLSRLLDTISLRSEATGSCVPYRSLSQGHAASMPDAGWAVGRTPPNPCSRDRSPDPGFDVASGLTTRHQRFTLVRLLETHLTEYSSAFSHNAHHQGSLPSQLGVVWSLLLQADSGGPPPSPIKLSQHTTSETLRFAVVQRGVNPSGNELVALLA